MPQPMASQEAGIHDWRRLREQQTTALPANGQELHMAHGLAI
jgi:hypothetical protein